MLRDIDLLAFVNRKFSLSSQNYWAECPLANGFYSKVMQELMTLGSPMAEWRQLLKLGNKYGNSGKPNVSLSKYLPTWTAVISEQLLESQQCLGGDSVNGN